MRIPKLRSGSFLPSLLERREVDDHVEALRTDTGISKSKVGRIPGLDVRARGWAEQSAPPTRPR